MNVINFRWKSHSEDRRTSVWEVTCVCGKPFRPTTTMMARQTFACPKCGKEYHANWNVPAVTLLGAQEKSP